MIPRMMRWELFRGAHSAVVRVAAVVGIFSGLANAGEVLFIGNSYTYGAKQPAVQKLGGVPKFVELIAASKGRELSTEMVFAGGKDLGHHLQQPTTEPKVRSKKWEFVVLQDLSDKATRTGNVAEFFQNGATFYKLVREAAPGAKVVLYETWARGEGSPLYSKTPKPTVFTTPAEMTAEIAGNHVEQERRLEALEDGEQVLLAPVGEAFQACRVAHPEISLYSEDNHHASTEGIYLSALVIYSTLTGDSPLGATHEFPGVTIPADTARLLQEVAAKTVAPAPANP
jgi:hypothetical protein